MPPTSSTSLTFVCCSSPSIGRTRSRPYANASGSISSSRSITRRSALITLASPAVTLGAKIALAKEQCPVLDTTAPLDPIDPSVNPPTITDSVELWIRVGTQSPKRTELQLYGCIVPETVSNFLQLVRQGAYNQTSVYRIVPQLTVQMGDVLNNRGSSGRSAAEDGHSLPPENYLIRHTCPGIISMARDREGRVDSRFFVTTRPGDSAYLDDRYVAFGCVTKDTMGVFNELERFVGPANTPRVPVFIDRAVIV